jgi:competence protein ComEA
MRLSRPAALAALGFLLAAPALAQTATPNTTAKPPGTTTAPTTQPSVAQAAQQERMTACNAESRQKKLSGDKRKSFMADCLAGKPASAATTAAPTPGTPATTTTAPSQAGLIDINTANKEQLDALPQIGSARAEAIIKGRPYKAKNELLDRYIVPQNVYDAIKDKIVARQKS